MLYSKKEVATPGLWSPPAYWGPPAQPSAAGSAAKIFQPLKMTAFRGSKGEQGAKAMRVVQSMDVYKDSTANLTENQICMTMWANLTDSARDWVHTENEAYKKLHGRAPLLGNWTALLQKFIDRYGLVNPAESLQRLSQLRQGSDEAVANVAQRARDLFIEAHVEHDKIKIHKIMMSLRSPLWEQLHTARPKTFEEAVEVAVALEDGLWTLEDFKVPNNGKGSEDTVRVAEDKSQTDSKPLAKDQKEADPSGARAPNNRSGFGGRGGGRGRGRGRGRGGGQGKPRECWTCGKVGHFQDTCPMEERNHDKVHWTYGSGTPSPYDGITLEEEEVEHSTVRVASMCNFGWKGSPVLDLDDAAVLEEPAEEQGTVRVARNQPQLMDEFRTRARMLAGRTPVPVNRPIVPATTGPGGGAQNPGLRCFTR
jgi:hypothetical protein